MVASWALCGTAFAGGFTQIIPAPDGTSAASEFIKIKPYGKQVSPAFKGVLEQLESQKLSGGTITVPGEQTVKTQPQFDADQKTRATVGEWIESLKKNDAKVWAGDQNIWLNNVVK